MPIHNIVSMSGGKDSTATLLVARELECSGQLIPDTTLSFSSARAGANPSLN
ncbi:hypothetical protein [Pseudomonas sp. A-RE-26]|uniref:hypothetical protein n=1 Tax=Pseudomonas sp. A-RE-26 TaxID=2832402 RepID=UPI001CBD4E1E|nr:hypothetical protein [Pseudomonas sp. A-RE-26]